MPHLRAQSRKPLTTKELGFFRAARLDGPGRRDWKSEMKSPQLRGKYYNRGLIQFFFFGSSSFFIAIFSKMTTCCQGRWSSVF